MARLLLALISLSALGNVVLAQERDTTSAGYRARFDSTSLTLSEPASLRAPWLGAPRVPAAMRAAEWDSLVSARVARSQTEARLAWQRLQIYGPAAALQPLSSEPADTTVPLDDPAQPSRNRGLLGIDRNKADLAIDGQARLEVRTDRLRNERCTPILILDPNSGCRGGFKPPRLENQFTIRSAGVIARRFHLNVDYDTQRDFEANNNIQVYYEGLDDEILRRVEVGTVSFIPPRSRFITAAIPTNNFGVNATFEVGPLQLQTLAATQKGSVVAERTYTIGTTTTQPQDRQVRDLDFESGRFFWLVDPRRLTGYPAVDILGIAPTAAPDPADRPQDVRLYRHRASLARNGTNPNLGGITAIANRRDSDQRLGGEEEGRGVQWELLIEGTDYYLDPSRLWIALSSKLDPRDYLAVSFTNAAGTRVGTFPSEDQSAVADTLELIYEPQQEANVPTFFHEMRQVYRVAGTDLDVPSLEVSVSLNRSERPPAGAATYLALLGISLPTDANVFDRTNRLFPRQQDETSVEQVLGESYIIFPHLTPFADASRLTPPERADSLYRTPLYSLLERGPPPKFQLRLRYNASGSGDRNTLNLNALQIREGSEQLVLNGRVLERDVDYTISYEVGQVTFINPETLFGRGGATVSARFEERGLFAIAPTTILGFSSRYAIGQIGAVNLIGMYQKESTPFNRPPLGFEATANLVGGVSTELHFTPNVVTRFLDRFTSAPATAPSRLDLNAEYALTRPDLNRSGEAYLDEFEGDGGTEITLRETTWEHGSRPQRPEGFEDLGGAGLDSANAVQLVWQNLVLNPATGSQIEIRPENIDTLIRVVGRGGERVETPLFVTLHADTAGGIVQRNNASRWSQERRPFEPRWRSMVTPLSTTGLDLTRNEYLEFWVFQSQSPTAVSTQLRVVLDLGTVSEDAFGLAPSNLSLATGDSVFTGRQYVGVGRLDTERDVSGVFNADLDDVGILGDRPETLVEDGDIIDGPPLCQQSLTSSVSIYPWGDLSSRCSRGNGALDTEDLDADNVLNARGGNENVFRYVLDLFNPASEHYQKYFVRDGQQQTQADGTVAGWKLYRVPLRNPDFALGSPNLRLVQHLRMTFATPADNGGDDQVARLIFARMRLVGSSWARRSETPIAGIAGSTGQPHGEVIVSVVSTENKVDLGYESPPGIGDQLARRDDDLGSVGQQINEKSLRVVARDIRAGERAEGYFRFPAGPQNLLNYRQMKVWARGRGPGWDGLNELQAFVKLGSDDQNFYLYRTPARTTTWEPEIRIDLEKWRQLRGIAENRWLAGEAPSGAAECAIGDPNAYVVCDGPYVVHLGSPGINPPNLAAVQELSAGIYREAGDASIEETEVWIDDIRLAQPISEVGTAVALDGRLTASDVGDVTVSYIRQDGRFQQINQAATFRTTGTLQVGTNWRLDRFLPSSLGLSLPVTVSIARAGVNPELLSGTDLRGSALAGLRKPESWSTTYSASLRRSRRGSDWITRGFVDPFALSATMTRGNNVTDLSQTRARTYNINLNYNLQLERSGPRLGLGGLVARLPRWLRNSEAGKGLADARVSLAPTSVRFTSGLTRDEGNFTSFRLPIRRPEDNATTPTVSLNHFWRNNAGLTWQPLGMLTLSSDLTSTRDLRVYPDSSPLGRLAYQERRNLLGVPVGVERDRTLSSQVTLAPRIASWIRPRFTTSSNFLLNRTLNSREPVRVDGDTAGAFVLPQTLNNSRTREIGASLDLSRAVRGLFGDSTFATKWLGRFRPIDISNRLTRTSTFDLATFDAGLGYQLAFGGLEKFLGQEGEQAISASDVRTMTMATGFDLPFGLTATTSYSLTRTTRYQRQGDAFAQTIARQREFPVGNLRWTRTFRGGPITVLGIGAGIRRRLGTTQQPLRGGAFAITELISTTLTPDIQIGFRNGVNVNVSGSSLDQENRNNGNVTSLDQLDLNGSLTYVFRMPAAISRSRKQVRSNLSALYSRGETCLLTAAAPTCRVVSDVTRQELRGGLDTDVLRTVSAGLQFGYSINDAVHLNRRTSQIFISTFFQLSLFAGDYR